jgi:nucleoside-diphosphate-sugar epimerase
MTIAVTGAGGSIGRALAAFAARSGYAAVDFPNHAQLDLAGPRGPLADWLAGHRPDAIVHLAGRRRGDDVSAAFRDNVAATYNLLTAVAAMDTPVRVVVASSAAVYGNARRHAPLAVDAERRPRNLYGASKALQEDACSLVRTTYGTDVTMARIFNIVGAPGDTWSVIPSLIARIGASRDGDAVHVTDANCTRDFVHVDDVCSALLLAATAPAVPPVFDVATGVGTEIGDIARRIAGALRRTVDLRFDAVTDATTIIDSVGDPREAAAIGWTHRTVFKDDRAILNAYAES